MMTLSLSYRKLLAWSVAAGVATASGSVQARLQVADLFTDGAVLQQGQVVPVWGSATPGAEVEVRFRDFSKRTLAAADGSWRVVFAPLEASYDASKLEIVGDGAAITLNDVLVGEVWVCSGQSNMQYAMKQTEDGLEAAPSAKDPHLRWFGKPLGVRASATWLPTTPEHVANFSAVAYFFGRHLREHRDVPVGLIVRAVGGTTVQRWVAPESVKTSELLQKRVADAKAKESEFDRFEAEQKKYDRKNRPDPETAAWLAEMSNLAHYRYPFGGLYQRMIRPLQPYGIAGVIWYQGEFNNRSGQAYDYREWQPVLIEGWRDAWGLGDFPFLFVQLQVLGNATTCQMRESQALTLDRVPNTAMAVICDESSDLHPARKQVAGDRLALAARELVHGESVAGLSPELASVEFEDGACYLTFDHVGEGLELETGSPESGFVVRGEDLQFVHADAELVDKNRVKVSAEGVADPVAVRYGWWKDPRAVMTLRNSAGLPASPFRTDRDAVEGMVPPIQPTSLPKKRKAQQ